MVDVEIDSFTRKFKLLVSAGHQASLNLDSHLGEVQITLNCKLGRIIPPPLSPPSNRNGFDQYIRVSPSRKRRNARRVAAREEAQKILTKANGSEEESVQLDVSYENESASRAQTGEICGRELQNSDVDSTIDTMTETVVDSSGGIHVNETEKSPNDEMLSECKDIMIDDTTNGISIVPMKNLIITDEKITHDIREKLEAKNVSIRGINIHRDTVNGFFVRCDVHFFFL